MVDGLTEIDLVVAVLIAPNIFLPWIAIVKAAIVKPDEYTIWPTISIYYGLLSFTTMLLTSSIGLLASLKPLVGEISIYAFTSTLTSMIPLVLSEKVRERFFEAIPRLNLHANKVARIQRNIYGGSGYRFKNSFEVVRDRYYDKSRGQRLSRSDPLETVSSKDTALERPLNRGTVVVNGQVIKDRGYIEYLKWCDEKYLYHNKLTYSEFVKIREAISKILSIKCLEEGSELGVPELSILARISIREDLRNNSAWAGAVKKLNNLQLISKNYRLMPRGVRLVKALKEAGLIEKLAEQTKP